jgi:PAS domain S-box-containing protein
MFLFGLILVVMAVSAIVTNHQMNKASEQERIASSIAQGANELSYLANDYLIYRESQQLKRWQSRFASFFSQVASLNVEKPEQQALAHNIQANAHRLREVFESVAPAHGSPSWNQGTALDPMFLQVSWSRMAVQSQGLVSDASRLSQLLHQQMDQLTERRTVLMYVMVGLFGAFLLISYMLTYRRILKSLAALQAGTTVIGSGNLDFVIEEQKNDEIGDLSCAFNKMTANLKGVTASKSELESEIGERKRAEEALRESGNKFRIVAEFTYDWEYWRSLDNRFLYVSPSCERITGYTREEFIQDPGLYSRIIHPNDRESMAAHLRGDQSHREPCELEFRIMHRNGQERWIGHACQPVLDADGQSLGRRASDRDITARKQAEEALRRSEARYRSYIEVTEQLGWTTNADGEVAEDIPAWRKFTGQSEEQVKGWGWSDALHPDDLEQTARVWRNAVATKNRYETEYRLRRYDGVYRHFLALGVPVFKDNGDIREWIGTCIDITERKQAEEALRRSEARLNRAQEIAHLGSWELDLMNNRLNWSDEVYRIFGLQPQEFGATYEAFLEAVHPDDRTAVDAAYSGSVREGRDSYEIEHRVVIKSTGEIRIVHERCEHIRDASGRIIRSIGMVHDITERKLAEEALQQRSLELQQLTETLERRVRERTEELEEANKALRNLSTRLLSAQEEERKRIAGELHDTIGACLSGIKFKVENSLLKMGKTQNHMTESLKTILPVIQEGVEECRRIQMDLRPSMLDDLGLLPTLSWFCRRFQTIYSGIRIEQEIDIKEGDVPPPLKIVAFRVTQEAMNNSAKHSKANILRLSLRKISGRIQLVLEDNGRGFDLEKVLGSESKRRGLGLTSMRERTELSGGSFDIESGEGKGTIIRAWWPL